jgi:PIN domain nuclease of toxin-antitoxin system
VIALLDTHALLWWLTDSPELSEQGRSTIADPLNDVLISSGVIWEIEIKRALGKLDAPDDLVDVLEPAGLGTLPITLADATQAGRLPPHHRDPFDRMLVAQAKRLDGIVISRDAIFERYEVDRIPT